MKNMKKFLLFALIMLIFALIAQSALAVPPWKKNKESGTTATTAAAPEPQVIYVNQTVPVQEASINWEMIGVIIAIAGVSIGWLVSRKIRGKTARYMDEIDKVYRTYNKNSNRCETELTSIRKKIENDFKKGKINDQSLAILETRIDKYSEKLRTDIIEKGFKLPSDMKKKIKHMLSDGVITKEEHKNFEEIIKGDHGMSKSDEKRLKVLMKKWKEEDKR